MIELNRIYNEDCISGMKRIPDASIDAVICDLPFGTTQNQWDSVIPFDGLWEAYKRIIKPNGVIALFAQTPFDKVLGCSNLPWLKYEWIWENGTDNNNYNNAMNRKEQILNEAKKRWIGCVAIECFIDGAEYADENPVSQWHDIRDVYPHETKYVEMAIRHDEDGSIEYAIGLFFSSWFFRLDGTYTDKVTHWKYLTDPIHNKPVHIPKKLKSECRKMLRNGSIHSVYYGAKLNK